MNEVDKKKSEIRSKYLKIRKSVLDKKKKSLDICTKLILTEEYQNSKIIALYKNLETEVDTNQLIEVSVKNGKIVALPRVENDNMVFYKINSLNDKLEKNEFGIYEPISNIENIINKDELDLVIVPGICFDKNMNRLGFGKGFYDKFLFNSKSKILGICFEEQVLCDENIPFTRYDVKMQKVITDKKVYKGE